MTLTVRLDDTLALALERHCAATGATKSLVVQKSLAAYLMASQTPADDDRHQDGTTKKPFKVSANYRAFAEAGFIGAGELGGGSADNAAVRALALQRIRRAW